MSMFSYGPELICSSRSEEDRIMRMRIGLLSVAGILGLLAAAQAAGPFDGTYQFASSKKVSETFENKGAMGVCPDRQAGPLTVVDGVAQYATETGRDMKGGRVGPNGAFEMSFVQPDGSSSIHVVGAIDRKGTAHARQKGNSCSYDFIWQKQS